MRRHIVKAKSEHNDFWVAEVGPVGHRLSGHRGRPFHRLRYDADGEPLLKYDHLFAGAY